MLRSRPFVRKAMEIHHLSRSKFDQQDIRVHRHWLFPFIFPSLASARLPFQHPGIHIAVVIELSGICLGTVGRPAITPDSEVEDHRVPFIWRGSRGSLNTSQRDGPTCQERWMKSRLTFVFHRPRIYLQRNQSETMTQHLILHDRCVVPNIYLLNCDCWHLYRISWCASHLRAYRQKAENE